MGKADPRQQIIDDIAGFELDPLGLVLYAFPWGEPGTELEKCDGPRQWQRDVLCEISDRLRSGEDPGEVLAPILEAVASGHGIGKSALVAWIVWWALSTRVDAKSVITANTEAQLRTKTWPELGKWHRLAINRDWFKFTATAIYSTDPGHEKTWRADAIPWSETRTEAFAGLHNQGGRILVVFDEASAVPDVIWEVTEGALTDEDTQIIWAVFGNPTRNTGRFRECFGRLKHRWSTRQIDSRDVPGTNKKQIQEWVDDYGEDSDFVRVRVRGVFPRASATQFISSQLTEGARKREVEFHRTDPVIMGVDVAREGGDESVIAVRIGLDARTIEWKCLRVPDTMELVGHIASMAMDLKQRGLQVAMIAVDAHAMGVGVADRLQQLGWPVYHAFNWPSQSDSEFHNPNDRWWSAIREWLKVGAIPDDNVLIDQLTSREMGFDARNRLSLEKKKDMKKRGLSSPDRADALALTFSCPVAPTLNEDHAAESGSAEREYDPFG